MDIGISLEKYADLVVSVGINLKVNEGLIISTSQYGLPLAREITKKAYMAGAKHVEIFFNDDVVTLHRYNYGKDSIFDTYPEWKLNTLISMYDDNYHHIFINSPNPELLKEIPADIVSRDQLSSSVVMAPAVNYRMTAKTKWTILAVPSPAWAKAVFPDMDTEQAINSLWSKIFDATRVSEDNPTLAWQIHNQNLKKYVNFLNDKNFDKLVFKGPGTRLEVGLANQHNWVGGSKNSQAGDAYLANIPTEEVFTTPHRLRVNGTLTATKPLSLNGVIVDNFGFTFKDGKVIDYFAGKGKEALDYLLLYDEGAKFLGEVALVPYNSPISNTGILFNNTLFDENAAVHFALGRSYGYAMQSGASKSQDTLQELGANFSLIHTDFMVGSPELDIIGILHDSTEIALFRKGNWVI